MATCPNWEYHSNVPHEMPRPQRTDHENFFPYPLSNQFLLNYMLHHDNHRYQKSIQAQKAQQTFQFQEWYTGNTTRFTTMPFESVDRDFTPTA